MSLSNGLTGKWTMLADTPDKEPYDGDKWQVELDSDASGKKTMKLINAESGYVMDFVEGWQ